MAFNRLDNVRVLLAGGAAVEGRDNAGRTALMSAASHGHGEIAAALLAAGADLNAKDEEGRTALMHAREHQHQDVALLLQEAGAKE